MSQLKRTAAVLAVLSALGLMVPAARAVKLEVKKTLGVPTGVVITLSHAEAQKVGKGERLDIPGVPAKFEKPFRNLAAKIKEADKGSGVKVTLKLRAGLPPRVSSTVESR